MAGRQRGLMISLSTNHTTEENHRREPSLSILFDDDNLYVAIRAFDTSPDSIVNRLTRRDEADGDLVA